MSKLNVITGAGGMDAKELTHILLARGDTVILTYRRNSQQDLGKILSLFNNELLTAPGANLQFQFLDISDKSSVHYGLRAILEKYGRIDNLFLTAAASHVKQSFEQPELSIITNGQSYFYFLESLRELSKNTRVYGCLTSELAGNVPEGTVFNEQSPWSPRSPYSCGKMVGGYWIKHYREAYGMNACYGILFNHSSIYRSLDFFIRKMTSAFAKIALGKQKQVEFGFLDFWRDEGYSSLYAEQMIKIVENPAGPKDFIVSTGRTHHAEEYLDLAARYFNLDWTKIVKKDESLMRPREVVRLVGDSSLAQRELGWRPNRLPFQDHINIMCKYDYELERGENPIRPDVLKMYP